MLRESDIEFLKLKKLEESFEELEKDYVRLEFNRDYREIPYYRFDPTKSGSDVEIAISRRDEYVKKFIGFGIDVPKYTVPVLEGGIVAQCYYEIEAFRTKIAYRLNESKRVYKQLLEKEKKEEEQRILLQKQRDEQEAKLKEQRELHRKAHIHKEALIRLHAKKAKIEADKLEAEILAEMERIESSM